LRKHVPEKITIHCTATENFKRVEVETIKDWHRARGFSDVGYHMVIQPDGEKQRGRCLNVRGAHVKGHNTGNLGLCLVGNDKFTWPQMKSAKEWIDSIRLSYDIPYNQIFGHYELDKSGKTCPNIRITDLVLWMVLQDDKIIKKYVKEAL
jgi:N-acetyl-anhydromuramyl-L-alanine amidase AmpD